MTTADPAAFATQWVADWNARDLDRILAHYADDVVFRSPIAARVRPDSGGILAGKAALADYWGAALPMIPDLHFTLEETFATVGGLTILYRNQRGQQVAESLLFGDDGLVVFGMGAYAPEG
jgi:ketosteroid isomerase-like protein